MRAREAHRSRAAARAAVGVGALMALGFGLAPAAHAAAAGQTLGLSETAQPANQDIALTYQVTNHGTAGVNDVSVSSSLCGRATYLSGDQAPLDILDAGETWTFSCVLQGVTPGSYTDSSHAAGTTVGTAGVLSADATATVTVPAATAQQQATSVTTISRPAAPGTTTTTLAQGHVYLPDQLPATVAGSSGTRTTTAGSSDPPAATAPALAFTGRDVTGPVLVGLGLIALGLALLVPQKLASRR